MHVPVFLTAQVLVKMDVARTELLSGTVTSATKDALFVQSGELVGLGVAGVAVTVGGAAGVSRETSASVDVGAVVSVDGAVVAATGGVASSEGLTPQPVSSIAVDTMTTMAFRIISTSSATCETNTPTDQLFRPSPASLF
jgi:hypothetical protein